MSQFKISLSSSTLRDRAVKVARAVGCRRCSIGSAAILVEVGLRRGRRRTRSGLGLGLAGVGGGGRGRRRPVAGAVVPVRATSRRRRRTRPAASGRRGRRRVGRREGVPLA